MADSSEYSSEDVYESGRFVKIVWGNDEDRQLLRAVDEYIAEFGGPFEQDWQLIATFAFEDPRQLVDVRSRYRILSETLTIKTFEEYNAYQKSPNKAAWVYGRRLDKMTTSLQRSAQISSLKAWFKEIDEELEKDLLFLKSVTTYDTLLHRRIWKYLGGYERIGLMRYLDVADKLLDRMPNKETGRWARNEENVIEDFREIVAVIGEPFERDRAREIPQITLDLPAGLHSTSTEIQEINPLREPYCIRTLDSKVVRKMMEDRVDGMFTPEEWEKIFTVKDSWQPLLVRIDRGKNYPSWFTDKEYFGNDNELFRAKLATVGIETLKTRQDVEVEYFSYVIPNYWIFPDFLIKKDSRFENLMCRVWFGKICNEVCIVIYNSLTFISLKHIRKTIIYLTVCGVLKDHGYRTPTEYLNGFIKFLLELPCGECWGVNPVQFQNVRDIVKTEIDAKGLTVPEIQSVGYPPYRHTKCIKGEKCFWLST